MRSRISKAVGELNVLFQNQNGDLNLLHDLDGCGQMLVASIRTGPLYRFRQRQTDERLLSSKPTIGGVDNQSQTKNLMISIVSIFQNNRNRGLDPDDASDGQIRRPEWAPAYGWI